MAKASAFLSSSFSELELRERYKVSQDQSRQYLLAVLCHSNPVPLNQLHPSLYRMSRHNDEQYWENHWKQSSSYVWPGDKDVEPKAARQLEVPGDWKTSDR